MPVQVQLVALDREAAGSPTAAARSGGCAASPSPAASAPPGRARMSGCRPPARATRRSGCSRSPQRRAFRFISPTKRRSLPDTCTASAIAASLPDTSSRPLSSASSRTRRPLRQQPDPRPRVVQRRLRDLDPLRRPRPLDHDQRGHDLRQARDRQHPQRAASPEHLAVVEVEHEPRPRRLAQRQSGTRRPRRGRRPAAARPGSGFGLADTPRAAVRRRVHRDRQPRAAPPALVAGRGRRPR